VPGPPPGGPEQPPWRKWLIPGIAIAAVIVVIAVVAGGGGDDDEDATVSATGVGEVIDTTIEDPFDTAPNSTVDRGGPVGSLTPLVVSDLPSGFRTASDDERALPIATCAGAVEPVDSTVAESELVSFTQDDGKPAVTESIIRYSNGAEAHYALLERSIADCRARVDPDGSEVTGASRLELPALGDERTGGAVLLGRAGNPADPRFALDMATVRLDDVILTITVSGPEGTIPDGFTVDLITKAVAKLR
jgi:hypothetical protein